MRPNSRAARPTASSKRARTATCPAGRDSPPLAASTAIAGQTAVCRSTCSWAPIPGCRGCSRTRVGGWRRPQTAHELDAAAAGARTLLLRSATLTLTLSADGGQKTATVRVINETGHKLPTGYPEGRRLWLNVRAFDASGRVVFSSGNYRPSTGILVADPWLKVYEIKQGLTSELAAHLGQDAGATFHFALNNTTVKDNRIPPRGYTQAAWDQPGLRPVDAVYADGQHWDDTVYPLPTEAVAVTALLYYQTASKEYVDFLRAEGGADGATLGQLWDDLPSPPEVIAVALDPEYPLYLPFIDR